MSTIGSTLTSMNYGTFTSSMSQQSTTSIMSDRSTSLQAKNMATTLNPKGRLASGGMLNIRSEKRGMDRDLAHGSVYGLDLTRNWLPVEVPNPPQDVVLSGKGHIETKMNYAEINGWLNDIPVMYTVMMANRSYEDTKLIFSNRTKRLDNTTTNRWIM